MLLQSVFTKSRLHQITKSVSADIISRSSIKIGNYLNIQAAKLIHLIIFLAQACTLTKRFTHFHSSFLSAILSLSLSLYLSFLLYK